MAFALLLVLAATVFTLVAVLDRALAPAEVPDTSSGLAGTTATLGGDVTSSTTAGGSSSTDTTSAESTSQIRPATATASSTLKATSTNNYGATNLLDGDVTTAWSEGANGSGIGESVTFTFSSPTVLTRIEIANGYQKDQQRFEGNPRVQTLRLEYSNGTTQLVDLLDSMEFQSIVPTRQPVEWVKMVIVSVYAGTVWDDTSLSEVRFYGASQ
jgi:hypothetical protein